MIRGKPMYKQQGMVYLWALFLVFLLGLGLGKSLEVYSVQLQRQQEVDLLDIGQRYQQAIQNYYLSSPGYQKKYPDKITDLLKDPRYLTTRRYLRKLYKDPMTLQDFELITSPEGGIMGVKSTSTKRPIKQAQFDAKHQRFEHATRYSEWQFIVY